MNRREFVQKSVGVLATIPIITPSLANNPTISIGIHNPRTDEIQEQPNEMLLRLYRDDLTSDGEVLSKFGDKGLIRDSMTLTWQSLLSRCVPRHYDSAIIELVYGDRIEKYNVAGSNKDQWLIPNACWTYRGYLKPTISDPPMSSKPIPYTDNYNDQCKIIDDRIENYGWFLSKNKNVVFIEWVDHKIRIHGIIPSSNRQRFNMILYIDSHKTTKNDQYSYAGLNLWNRGIASIYDTVLVNTSETKYVRSKGMEK